MVFAAVALAMGAAAAFVLGDLFLLWWDLTVEQRPLGQAIPWTRMDDPPINDQSAGGLRLKRFLDCRIVDPISKREVSFRTNQFGYRGPPLEPKAAGECRILVLGDSITLSSYTEERESYPRQLEGLLAEDGHAVTVINAGMRGASLREELLILTETGLFTDPDVVLVGMFLNDANRSRMIPMPEGLFAYSAIARRLREISLMNELAGDARRRWEQFSDDPFPEATFPEGAWRTDREAFMAMVAKASVDWGFAWFEAAWQEMRPDLEVMRGLAERHGFTLAVALFPATYQVEAEFVDDRPQRMFREMAEEVGVPHLDLLPGMRAAYRRLGRSLSYDHCHLTPEGSRVAAELLAPFIRSLGPCPHRAP